jgi:hypothetical protein
MQTKVETSFIEVTVYSLIKSQYLQEAILLGYIFSKDCFLKLWS